MSLPRRNIFPIPPAQEDIETTADLSLTREREANTKIASLSASALFFMYFLSPRTMMQFLGYTFGRILLPAAAITSVLGFYWKMRDYQKQKQVQGDSSAFMSLVVEGILAAGVVTAVAAALLTQAAFMFISPLIIVTTVGIKSLFEIGMAISEFRQARAVPETASELTLARKAELYRSARKHLELGLVSLLITTSVALMSFAGLAAFAAVGMLASAAGAVIENGYKEGDTNLKLVTLRDPLQPETREDEEDVVDNRQQQVQRHSSTHLATEKLRHSMPYQQTIVSGREYNNVMATTTVPVNDPKRRPQPGSSTIMVNEQKPDHTTPDFNITDVEHSMRSRMRM